LKVQEAKDLQGNEDSGETPEDASEPSFFVSWLEYFLAIEGKFPLRAEWRSVRDLEQFNACAKETLRAIRLKFEKNGGDFPGFLQQEAFELLHWAGAITDKDERAIREKLNATFGVPLSVSTEMLYDVIRQGDATELTSADLRRVVVIVPVGFECPEWAQVLIRYDGSLYNAEGKVRLDIFQNLAILQRRCKLVIIVANFCEEDAHETKTPARRAESLLRDACLAFRDSWGTVDGLNKLRVGYYQCEEGELRFSKALPLRVQPTKRKASAGKK
jgi:hypothetical protein